MCYIMEKRHIKDFYVEVSAWIPFYETKDYALRSYNLSTASSKGIKLFREEFKRKHIKDVDVKVVRL